MCLTENELNCFFDLHCLWVEMKLILICYCWCIIVLVHHYTYKITNTHADEMSERIHDYCKFFSFSLINQKGARLQILLILILTQYKNSPVRLTWESKLAQGVFIIWTAHTSTFTKHQCILHAHTCTHIHGLIQPPPFKDEWQKPDPIALDTEPSLAIAALHIHMYSYT